MTAALALATSKAREVAEALAEANEIIKRDQGEALDRTTMAD